MTLGLASAKVDEPPMHWLGMDAVSTRYACQSGVGVAGPMHNSRRVPPGSPVDVSASAINVGASALRKRPTPPRMVVGPLKVVARSPALMLVPLGLYVQLKPSRGLRAKVFGT